MNRIPNYRVWHKIEKRYVDLRSIDFEKENIGYDAYREGNYYDIASFKDVVFQQFTGKKDLKGKNLYEGDIIKFLHEEKYVKSEVVYKFGMFAVVLEPNEENEILTYKSLFDVGEFEIIGNFVD